MTANQFLERVGFSGDVTTLLRDIAHEFSFGAVQTSEVITTGFEDCNIKLETNQGVFLVKLFAKTRSNKDTERYITIMQAVIEGGVKHPKLFTTKSGDHLLQHPAGVRLVVMDFIAGRTYFETKSTPSDEELTALMREIVKIHALDIEPEYATDSWSITNIHNLYSEVERVLDEEGRALIQGALLRYDAIDKSKLTTCFVHGDLTSTNVLRSDNGSIWILDFSVANLYPKIQELAVVATSLLAAGSLQERVQRTMRSYLAAGGQLSEYEQNVLPDYTVASAAMEFMGGFNSKYIKKHDLEEADHWLHLGKKLLKEVLG